MNFNDYQKKTDETDIYSAAISKYVDSLEIPDKVKAYNLKDLLGLTYVILGLAGEAGKVANKMKKILRDNDGQLFLSNLLELGKENGDALWYNARIFKHIGLDFEEGAELNIKKLSERKQNGTLTGSGDIR